MPPESRINLNPVDESDLEELVRLHADAFSESEEMYGVGPPGYNDLAHHKRILEEHNYFKITMGEALIGGIIVQDHGEGDYFLDTIFIGSAYQNLGLGREAMRQMEAQFPDAKRWMLFTPYRDFRNHHFYESQGYRKVDDLPILDGGSDPNFTLFKYEKWVE